MCPIHPVGRCYPWPYWCVSKVGLRGREIARRVVENTVSDATLRFRHPLPYRKKQSPVAPSPCRCTAFASSERAPRGSPAPAGDQQPRRGARQPSELSDPLSYAALFALRGDKRDAMRRLVETKICCDLKVELRGCCATRPAGSAASSAAPFCCAARARRGQPAKHQKGQDMHGEPQPCWISLQSRSYDQSHDTHTSLLTACSSLSRSGVGSRASLPLSTGSHHCVSLVESARERYLGGTGVPARH